MAEVQITDPGDLFPEERKMAADIADLPAADFDQVVARFVREPGGTGETLRRVLYSPDLAQDTLTALGRLHAEALRLAAAAPRHSELRRMRNEQVRYIAGLRDELRPYVTFAVQAAAERNPRRRAERILGRVRYRELRQIMADLAAGMSEQDAEAAHRSRASG